MKITVTIVVYLHYGKINHISTMTGHITLNVTYVRKECVVPAVLVFKRQWMTQNISIEIFGQVILYIIPCLARIAHYTSLVMMISDFLVVKMGAGENL